MLTKEQQKILNYAFYATLAMSGLTLLLVFLGSLNLGLLAIAELIALPVLGLMVKKGNYKASIALLSLFIIDRIAFVINFGSQIITPTYGLIPFKLISAVYISWALWVCFYGSYKTLKAEQKKT